MMIMSRLPLQAPITYQTIAHYTSDHPIPRSPPHESYPFIRTKVLQGHYEYDDRERSTAPNFRPNLNNASVKKA